MPSPCWRTYSARVMILGAALDLLHFGSGRMATWGAQRVAENDFLDRCSCCSLVMGRGVEMVYLDY